jgi:hypothetical protein
VFNGLVLLKDKNEILKEIKEMVIIGKMPEVREHIVL